MKAKITQKNPRVKREEFTPLGEIFYNVELWVRLKIEAELLEELSIKRPSLRAYMVKTPAYRMRPDMKAIILRTLPEASDCFIDPRVSISVMS